MATTTVSITEFEQNAGRARMVSEKGPLFITESGRPANVLLTIEEYRTLTGKLPSLADLLAGPEGVGAIDFDPPRIAGIINPNREVDLSD